ncbi:hypothetical protein ABT213_06095 [Streptomyces sp. NPDC001674]|uniref:hypothetical protein n=1 Tax=Streptomyces sp. NPDC001674 TaxID=3154394 RepID=UPI00331A4A81
MSDLGRFISQDFGSVLAGGAALLAIPGVIVAGAIQGNKALKGAQAQADAALRAAAAQADKALEAAHAQAQAALQAAQEQAVATLETGRRQADASLAGIREMSREAHAQWQRDRCQEVWAEYVKELDLLLPKSRATEQESQAVDLLRAYAMVELLSPPNVLRDAREAKDGALDFGAALYDEHLHRENLLKLRDEKRRLRGMIADAALLSRNSRGQLVQQVQISADEWDFVAPDSREEFEEMSVRFEQGDIARAALEALAEAERTPGDRDVQERVRQALCDAGLMDRYAAILARTAGCDREAQRELLTQKRSALHELRDAFVETARRELDALGR